MAPSDGNGCSGEGGGVLAGAGRRQAGRRVAARPRPAELDELDRALHGMLASWRRLRGREASLGGRTISHAQFELLIELLRRGALPVGELAEAAQLSPATVTGMLDHLVAGAHVERLHSEQDRRVVLCRLTPGGRRQIEELKQSLHARWEAALGEVPAEDLRAAARVLERVSAIFKEVSGCEPASPPGGAGRNGRPISGGVA